MQVCFKRPQLLGGKTREPSKGGEAQRIMLRCRTDAFNKEQTAEYIRERLRIAGANSEPILSSKAIDTVHLYSLGIPRVINLTCEHSLVNAFAEHQRR
jgi:general secretion pathway protein A